MTAQVTVVAVVAVLAFSFCAIIYAARITDQRCWRQCIKCWRWFSDMGEITDHRPHTFNIKDPGVCEDCAKDIEFNRE